MSEFISGLLIGSGAGLLIGGFLGILGMCLCVICRDNKAVKEMDEFEED